MKLKELMERIGTNETGRAIAYLKDALEELEIISEVNIKDKKIDIVQNQRFYTFPPDMIKVVDITIKNHLNSKNEYRSIPRLIHKPKIKDEDNE